MTYAQSLKGWVGVKRMSMGEGLKVLKAEVEGVGCGWLKMLDVDGRRCWRWMVVDNIEGGCVITKNGVGKQKAKGANSDRNFRGSQSI